MHSSCTGNLRGLQSCINIVLYGNAVAIIHVNSVLFQGCIAVDIVVHSASLCGEIKDSNLSIVLLQF